MTIHISGLNVDIPTWQALGNPNASAVAFLFLEPESASGRRDLVLMRRSIFVSTHKGQIGFAGGRREPIDVSPAATALRELQEELGLPPERVKTLGILPAKASIDGTLVFPVAMVAQGVSVGDLIPASDEVAHIITAPLEHFKREKAHSVEFMLYGHRRHSYVYMVDSHRVWGLTAGIIANADLR